MTVQNLAHVFYPPYPPQLFICLVVCDASIRQFSTCETVTVTLLLMTTNVRTTVYREKGYHSSRASFRLNSNSEAPVLDKL